MDKLIDKFQKKMSKIQKAVEKESRAAINKLQKAAKKEYPKHKKEFQTKKKELEVLLEKKLKQLEPVADKLYNDFVVNCKKYSDELLEVEKKISAKVKQVKSTRIKVTTK